MKRSPLRRKAGRLKARADNETNRIKDDIQAYLREIVILRDGGCVLRHYPESGQCGSRPTKNGHIILQAEHLHTRSHSASYADSRLVVCLCERHHIFWKPQHADEYYKLIRTIIGPERSALLDKIQAARFLPSKMNWKLELAALKQEHQHLLNTGIKQILYAEPDIYG